jgi:hypothetical protein
MTSDRAAFRRRPRRTKNSWFAVLGVDEDQVDVGRDVQFAAAALAHGEHDQLLRPPRFFAGGHAVGGHHVRREGGGMGLDGEVGETGHGRDHLVQAGPAFQVAPDDGADEQVAQAPHGARQGQASLQLARQKGAQIEAGQR